MMNWYSGHGGMGWGEGLIVLIIVLLFFLMVVVTLKVFQALFRGTHDTEPVRPLDMLKGRYAAGEITHAEYEEARHAIE